jgi:charged multivesicular body protein 4
MPLNLFGKREKAPTSEEAINKLRETEEMLEKKSDHIEKQIKVELTKVKEYGTKNKRQALQHLKKKKRLEQQQMQVDNTLATIEYQREALMNAKANADILGTMQTASKTMKAIHKENNIDNVEDVMADIQEQQDIASEIADAISRPIDIPGLDVDDDELLAELDELEQEEIDSQMINTGPINTPAVPTSNPQTVEKVEEKDDDLDDLENWVTS